MKYIMYRRPQGTSITGVLSANTPFDPHVRTSLRPSLPVAAPPLLNVAVACLAEPLIRASCTSFLPSASSQALPAPKPSPTQAGHALRLKRRTEKTTPKERPRDERMRKEERAWSHCDYMVVSHDITGRSQSKEYQVVTIYTCIETRRSRSMQDLAAMIKVRIMYLLVEQCLADRSGGSRGRYRRGRWRRISHCGGI